MAFCENCGKELQEGEIYCENCGHKVGEPVQPDHSKHYSTEQLAPDFSAVNQSQGAGSYNPGFSGVVSHIPKKILIPGICAVIGVVILVIALIYSSTVINMNKYMDIKFDGYNGYGTATVDVDWDTIDDKYGDDVVYTLASCMDVELSKNSNLENGDVVDYKWKANDKALKKYIRKYSVKYSDGSATVDGLKKVKKIDVFAKVKLRFSGVSPDGKAEIDASDSGLDENYFYIDKYYGLSDGDTVTVSLTDESPEDYIDLIGGVPKEMSKKYSVDDLGHYITAISDISDDTKAALKKDAESKLDDIKDDFDSEVTAGSTTFVGDYLLVANDNSYSNKNTYGLIYRLDDTVKVNDTDPATNVSQYINVKYNNISVNDDKENGYDLEDGYATNHSFSQEITNSDDWFGYSYYYFTGYPSIADLKQGEVDYYSDDYKIEYNVDGEEESASTVSDDPDSYILPNSATETLTEDSLKDLTAQQLTYARNEIYARHGRVFQSTELQNYFNGKSWYQQNPNFADSDVSALENTNASFILDYQNSHNLTYEAQ